MEGHALSWPQRKGIRRVSWMRLLGLALSGRDGARPSRENHGPSRPRANDPSSGGGPRSLVAVWGILNPMEGHALSWPQRKGIRRVSWVRLLGLALSGRDGARPSRENHGPSWPRANDPSSGGGPRSLVAAALRLIPRTSTFTPCLAQGTKAPGRLQTPSRPGRTSTVKRSRS